ncbi:MAG: hypothetical protein ABR953_14365 [Candidatus Acidiferrales bacterium]
MIDQVLLDPNVPRNHLRDKAVGEGVFGVKNPNHLALFNYEHHSWCNRGRGSDPKRLAGEASLTKQIARSQTATTASLPVSLTIESLTAPFRMYRTFRPGSRCEKTVAFFPNSTTFLATPAESRKSWALNAPLALVFRRVEALVVTVSRPIS